MRGACVEFLRTDKDDEFFQKTARSQNDSKTQTHVEIAKQFAVETQDLLTLDNNVRNVDFCNTEVFADVCFQILKLRLSEHAALGHGVGQDLHLQLRARRFWLLLEIWTLRWRLRAGLAVLGPP